MLLSLIAVSRLPLFPLLLLLFLHITNFASSLRPILVERKRLMDMTHYDRRMNEYLFIYEMFSALMLFQRANKNNQKNEKER